MPISNSIRFPPENTNAHPLPGGRRRPTWREGSRPPLAPWEVELRGADRVQRAPGLRQMEPIVSRDQAERQLIALGPALGADPEASPPLVRGPVPGRDVGGPKRFEHGEQLLGGLGRTMELVDPPIPVVWYPAGSAIGSGESVRTTRMVSTLSVP